MGLTRVARVVRARGARSAASAKERATPANAPAHTLVLEARNPRRGGLRTRARLARAKERERARVDRRRVKVIHLNFPP